MPRAMTPAQLAKRMQKWADAGISYAVVDSMRRTLDTDRGESERRAPRLTGKLAKTVRVVSPSATRAIKTGIVRAGLAAGSRSSDRRKAVPYANILQLGGRTKPHFIRARRATYQAGTLRTTGVLALKVGGGRAFARFVDHPGSKFSARKFLRVNEPRAARALDDALWKGFQKDVS